MAYFDLGTGTPSDDGAYFRLSDAAGSGWGGGAPGTVAGGWPAGGIFDVEDDDNDDDRALVRLAGQLAAITGRAAPSLGGPAPAPSATNAPNSDIKGAVAVPPSSAGWFMDPTDFHARFFEQNYGPAAAVAASLGVDPALLLGVAAQESGWGRSDQAQTSGNPFGYMQTPGQAAAFPSADAAWQRWAATFGPRVRDIGDDTATFVRNLDSDNRGVYGPVPGAKYTGKYNSDDTKWAEKVTTLVKNVRNTLPHWLGSYDTMP